MARYNEFKYGAAKYGSTTRPGLTWGLEIDWNDDGAWSGDNEMDHAKDLLIRRGRTHYVTPYGDGFEPFNAGEMEVTIDNRDGRYDPYNNASPLYPYVMPGKRFRLRVRDDSGTTVYDVMRGRIQGIVPFTQDNIEHVRITGLEATVELENSKAYIGVSANKEAEVAVQDILNDVGWTGGSLIENSSETIPYWWAGGRSAILELRDLADCVLGVVFVGQDGRLKFYTRYHEPAPSYTLDDGDIMLGSMALEQPWEVVRNDIKIQVSVRTRYQGVDLWTAQDIFPLDAGATTEFWVEYNYNSRTAVGFEVLNPVAVTDYTANTAIDGSGTDLTANITVTVISYGEVARVTVTNGSASRAFLTLLKIRGDALVPDNLSTVQDTSPASIAKYQSREFNLKREWIQLKALADDYAYRLASLLSIPQFYPAVRLRNNVTKQLGVDLFDIVALNVVFKNIVGNYYVGHIEHRWIVPTGDLFDTVFEFEPVPVIGDYWTLDVSAFDAETILGF